MNHFFVLEFTLWKVLIILLNNIINNVIVIAESMIKEETEKLITVNNASIYLIFH